MQRRSLLPPIYIAYLNRLDIEELKITDDEILSAIEASLASQGRGETVIEPRVHLEPGVANGHFNVLRGAINAPIDASGITDMRTGAVTAIGAKHLARKDSKILGHIGARGTAYWNVRLLDHLFDFDEIRVHSRREESRNAFAEGLSRDLRKKVVATADWQSCVEGADIVVEASRLSEPTPLLKTAWIKPGALVVPYGTMSAIELSLTDIMTKLVVDDWGQCKGGKFGSLRAHVEAGKLSEATLHAELGQIVAGLKPGRQSDAETNLFWHRGLSLSDIALGHAMLAKAERLGIGQRLRFA